MNKNDLYLQTMKDDHKLKKGRKKTGGRQKGVRNKNTDFADAIIEFVLKEGGTNAGFQKIWQKLSPKEQADFIIKVLP